MARGRGSKKFSQGSFTPKNPEKYMGKGTIRYRSSWELHFMNFLDSNPNMLEWVSEDIKIPYRNPLTGKQTIYVPDFLIRYQDSNKKVIVELIEIKPKNQSMITEKSSPAMRATVALNHAKWESAMKWCARQGITFRVVTEDQMFRQ